MLKSIGRDLRCTTYICSHFIFTVLSVFSFYRKATPMLKFTSLTEHRHLSVGEYPSFMKLNCYCTHLHSICNGLDFTIYVCNCQIIFAFKFLRIKKNDKRVILKVCSIDIQEVVRINFMETQSSFLGSRVDINAVL